MEISTSVNQYLRQGEAVQWSGSPMANVHFITWDAFLIPFSLFVLWVFINQLSITNINVIDIIFFMFFYQFSIGRFFTKYRIKKRTIYYLTNERIIIYDKSKEKIIEEQEIKSVSRITKKIGRNGIGRVEFGKISLTQLAGGNTGMDFLSRTSLFKKTSKINIFDKGADQWIPVFYDIKDPEYVYGVANELRHSLNSK